MSVHNHNKRQGEPRWDGVQKFCVPYPPHSWARCGHGNNRSCMERRREKGRRRLGGGNFVYQEESRIPPSSSPPIPKKKYNKSLPYPRGTSGLKLLRAASSCPFPPPREAAPGRPSPSPPLRPLPRPREGKHKGARSGAGPGAHAPPGSPTIVPSQVPRPRLQLGFARRSHDVIRKSNEIMFSNSKN